MKKLAFIAAIALAFSSSAQAVPLVIEQMYLATFGHYTQAYTPANGSFMLVSSADHYVLSNGSSWESGAGSHSLLYSSLLSTQVVGSKIQYLFKSPASGILFQNTDYDSGNHSAQGVLGVNGPLMIEADIGSATGKLWGYTTILSNNATWYGEPRFNYYDAKVGDKVYFEENFSLLGASRFTSTLFQSQFTYNLTGVVDFSRKAASDVPEPATGLLVLAALATLAATRRRRKG